MNRDIRRYIYVVGAVIVLFLLVRVFFYFLPAILIIGALGYIVTKIIGLIKKKNKQSNLKDYKNSDNNDYGYEVTSDDYTNGEIIDVEYEELGDKKK